MTMLDISAAEALAGDFAGELITPDHPAYDDQRRIWNGEIDRRPAVLARCQGASDVASALRWARDVGLPVAVGNAVPEVREACVLQLTRTGGRGAVREFAELLLKARGEWVPVTERYVAERSLPIAEPAT